MPSSSRRTVKANASDLQRIVQIQQDTGTPDGEGGIVDNWTTVSGLGNVPMQFRTWSPYQQWIAQQQYPGVTSRCVMRYRKSAPVNAGMRVVYGNHIYKIRGVMNYDEANTAIQLYLEEVQATGSTRS